MSFGDADLGHYDALRLEDARRLRNLGILALIAAALPVSLSNVGSMFLWDMVAFSSPAEIIRLLAPAILGVGLIALAGSKRIGRLGLGLAALVLLIVCIALFTRSVLGYRAVFTGLMDYVGRRPLVVVGGLTMVAVGADLRRHEAHHTLSRWLLSAGGGLLLLLYVLPQRGDAFFLELVASADALVAAGGGKMILSVLLNWLFALFPLVMGCVAIGLAKPPRKTGIVGSFARYGLPALGVLLCYKFVMNGFGVHAIGVQLRASFLLAVVIGVASTAIEAIVLALLSDPLPTAAEPPSQLARDIRLRQLLRRLIDNSADDDRATDPFAVKGELESHPAAVRLMQRRLREAAADTSVLLAPDLKLSAPQARTLLERLEGRPEDRAEPRREAKPHALWAMTGPKRLYVVVGVTTVLLLGGLALRFQRSQADLTWNLKPATEAADRVFGRSLPGMILKLSRRNTILEKEGKGSAEDAVWLRQQREDFVKSVRDVDVELARHVANLMKRLDTVDFDGRLWFDALRPVNQRIRERGLPYFVDGSYFELTRDGRSIRSFYVVTYRVADILRYELNGHEYAALHVRRLDRLNVRETLLGFVREREPFALVLLDQTEDHVRRRIASLAGGSCDVASVYRHGPHARDVEEACIGLVQTLLKDRELTVETAFDELVDLQLQSTERHEVQHQIDGEDVDIPAELFRLLPIASDLQLARVSQEASAYLAELTSDDPLVVALTLAQLTEFLLDDTGQTPYRYAAGLIFGALLGQPVMAPMGHVDGAGVARLWQEAATKGTGLSTWLGPKAAEAHDDLIGSDLEEPQLVGAQL